MSNILSLSEKEQSATHIDIHVCSISSK